MRHLSITFAVLLLLAGSAGCATKSDSGGSSDRNLITAEEIDRVEARTAYEAVQRLRSSWLRRGRVNTPRPDVTPSRGLPMVYLDGIRAGGVDELRRIFTEDVMEIRYMSAPEATTRCHKRIQWRRDFS